MGHKRHSSIPLELDLSVSQKGCCSAFDDLALVYKALSHPARLMILSRIGKQNSRCCGDICSSLPLAQSTVSQHLKVLRECGLIELKTSGQQSHYRINHEKIQSLTLAHGRFFDQFGSPEPLD